MNRHGDNGQTLSLADPWNPLWNDPEPCFAGTGLPFVSIGTDLVLTAGQLARIDDNQAAGRGDSAWPAGTRWRATPKPTLCLPVA